MEEIQGKGSFGNGMNFGNDRVRIRVEHEHEHDRISSLPDEIIHHILSFNDIKYAVQTSVLSSRWKFIWKSLPYLNFELSEFRSYYKFTKFADRLLSFRNNLCEVSSVNLCFNGSVTYKFVEKIVSYAMSHNVQKLEVYSRSSSSREHRYPLCLFSSESLKYLSLRSDTVCFPLPQSPWDFPALTTLYLDEMSLLKDDNKCVELFSKCVNLKNLSIRNCRAKKLVLMKIVTPRLENLTIINCANLRFLVSAPNLSSFYYAGNGFHTPSLSTGNLLFLDRVNLQLLLSGCPEYDLHQPKEYLNIDVNKLLIMFEELRNAKFLTLHSSIIEVLATVPSLLETRPSPFINLKCLEIVGFDSTTEEANDVINYLTNNSRTATVIWQLPKVQLQSQMTFRAEFLKQYNTCLAG